MKKPILIANWKMNLNLAESVELAKFYMENLKDDSIEVALCPSAPFLCEVGKALKKSSVFLGAQNVSWMEKGAFTGEIPPIALKEAGCKFCIIGHSERREYLGENDDMVNKKALVLLKHMITPIICVGETWEERGRKMGSVVVERQLRRSLLHVKPVGTHEVIIAYEPIWAISTSGTGKIAEPKEVDEMNKMIMHVLRDLYPVDTIGNNFRLIYGGSVDIENVKSFVGLENVKGSLVGGASIRRNEFLRMVEAVK